jgi:hypothetical protein
MWSTPSTNVWLPSLSNNFLSWLAVVDHILTRFHVCLNILSVGYWKTSRTDNEKRTCIPASPTSSTLLSTHIDRASCHCQTTTCGHSSANSRKFQRQWYKRTQSLSFFFDHCLFYFPTFQIDNSFILLLFLNLVRSDFLYNLWSGSSMCNVFDFSLRWDIPF